MFDINYLIRAMKHGNNESASFKIVERDSVWIRKPVTGFDEIVTAATTSGNAQKKIVDCAILEK